MDSNEEEKEMTFEEAVGTLLGSMPKPVQDFLTGPDRDRITLELTQKYRLHADQAGVFQQAFIFMLLGISTPEEFTASLAEAGIDSATIAGLAADVNAKVFVPLREAERSQGIAPATPPVPKPAPVPAPKPVVAAPAPPPAAPATLSPWPPQPQAPFYPPGSMPPPVWVPMQPMWQQPYYPPQPVPPAPPAPPQAPVYPTAPLPPVPQAPKAPPPPPPNLPVAPAQRMPAPPPQIPNVPPVAPPIARSNDPYREPFEG